MRTVYILRGTSGMGKTTWTKKFIEEQELKVGEYAIPSADHYFEKPEGYMFDASKLPDAHGQCLKTFKIAINNDVDYVIVDNTNTQLWEFQKYVEYAEKRGYHIEIIDLFKENKASVEELAARNVHGLTADMIQKQLNRYQEY